MDRLGERPADRPQVALYGVLQVLGRPERYLLARGDRDGFARPRVACGARRPVSHLQDAEAAQADFVPLGELPGDERHEIVQDGFGGLF